MQIGISKGSFHFNGEGLGSFVFSNMPDTVIERADVGIKSILRYGPIEIWLHVSCGEPVKVVQLFHDGTVFFCKILIRAQPKMTSDKAWEALMKFIAGLEEYKRCQ